MDSLKIINLPEQPKKIEITKKEKKERVVIDKEHWNFDEKIYDPRYQLDILISKSDEEGCYKKMTQQINRKLNSYKHQDITKNLFNPDKIINNSQILRLLESRELLCYYCRKMVNVLYKNVREPLQWTLERIDNDYGHNHDNVTIACLECNLRRRTMYHERYVFTKQLVIKKI